MKKYCTDCVRNITPVKHFSWGTVILTLFLTAGILTVAYLIYYAFQRRDVCPICKGMDLEKAK